MTNHTSSCADCAHPHPINSPERQPTPLGGFIGAFASWSGCVYAIRREDDWGGVVVYTFGGGTEPPVHILNEDIPELIELLSGALADIREDGL